MLVEIRRAVADVLLLAAALALAELVDHLQVEWDIGCKPCEEISTISPTTDSSPATWDNSSHVD